MPVYRLTSELVFPPAVHAEPDGLLAVGGDLSPDRLLLAYASGIFPWYSEGEPILWFSPAPRMVLAPCRARVSRSLRRRLRGGTFRMTADVAFDRVVRACASTPRESQHGTWITSDMIEAYGRLHRLGFAHSIEVWAAAPGAPGDAPGELVGGLYGVSLGGAFFGESMFTHRADASKMAFVTLARQLDAWGFTLVDCQLPTAHLASLGATPRSRAAFTALLAEALESETRRGIWTLDPTVVPAADGE